MTIAATIRIAPLDRGAARAALVDSGRLPVRRPASRRSGSVPRTELGSAPGCGGAASEGGDDGGGSTSSVTEDAPRPHPRSPSCRMDAGTRTRVRCLAAVPARGAGPRRPAPSPGSSGGADDRRRRGRGPSSSRSSHAGSLTASDHAATSRPWRASAVSCGMALDHPLGRRREPQRDARVVGLGWYTRSRDVVVVGARRGRVEVLAVRRTARTRSTRNRRSSSARWHHAATYQAPNAWNTRHGSMTRVVISSCANE